jgi:hypothetical protein
MRYGWIMVFFYEQLLNELLKIYVESSSEVLHKRLLSAYSLGTPFQPLKEMIQYTVATAAEFLQYLLTEGY